MFFNFRYCDLKNDEKIVITDKTKISVADCNCKNYILSEIKSKLVSESRLNGEKNTKECKTLTFVFDFPESFLDKIKSKAEVSDNREQYALDIGEDSFIYALSEKGFVYGLSTLKQILDKEGISKGIIYDYPLCKERGYRVYMPGRENIPVFKEMIDLLAYYKYNSIILEVGGAMEYKKHPEINEKWVEFCDEMRRYSGRCSEIASKYKYEKDSVHCENGDGGFLTQDECKDIANYCKERGIEIIPECPTLSHSDYLLLPHPEYAERENDEIPDTYCPNNPEVYKYVFEVLDEVIDVFNPKRINIGHDEFYSVAVCPRCKGKDPVDIYVKDVETLNNYLKSKGISTLMWGEKMLKAVSKSGKHYGGWYNEVVYKDGTKFKIPDMYESKKKLPKDILYLNWYWYFDEKHDDVYHEYGYDMAFGNFVAINSDNYKNRIKRGAKGGFVSNWGSNDSENMQRNCQYFCIISSAYAFWCEDYDDDKRLELCDKTFREAYRKSREGKKNLIEVVHTTDFCAKFEEHWCGRFIDDKRDILGHYQLLYKDGTKAEFEVKYGRNIANSDKESPYKSEILRETTCFGGSSYREVSYSCLPLIIGEKLYCKCAFENPYPEKKIAGFKFVPAENKEKIDVEIYSVNFNS